MFQAQQKLVCKGFKVKFMIQVWNFNLYAANHKSKQLATFHRLSYNYLIHHTWQENS